MSTGENQGGLRRELRFWEAIALSIGIMAPTAAMALNGVGVAANVGQAVPLAFLISAILVFLVAFGIMRLAGHYSHAGSVYAFTGATLGPRAGFFSGWALLGTYLSFTVASTAEVGLFLAQFANGTGLWSGSEWIWIALTAAICVGILAYSDIKITTRTLLSIEAVSVLLITVLMVVIFVKIASGSAPSNAGFSADVFRLPSGTSSSALGLAVVLAFLSWAGSRARPRWARRRTSPVARSRARSETRSSAPASSTWSACWRSRGASAPISPASQRSRRPARRWATWASPTSGHGWAT